MNISKGTVVSIDYVLTDDDGNLVDQSDSARPLVYMQGYGNIIPGLEQALEGRENGDNVKVRIAPEQGYGVSRPEMVQVVPKDRFEGMDGEVQAGMQFHARTQEGGVIAVRVVKVEDNEVTIDGNHPLADQHLNFDVNVREIRLATIEELEHGHPHVEGGGCCGGGNCDNPDHEHDDSCDHHGGCGCQH